MKRVGYNVFYAIFLVLVLSISLFSTGLVIAQGNDDDDSDDDNGRDDDDSGNDDDDSDDDNGRDDDEVPQGDVNGDNDDGDEREDREMRFGEGEAVEARYVERERFRYVDANGIMFEYRYEYREKEDGKIEKRLRIERVGDDDLEVEIEDELEIEEEIGDDGERKLKVKASNGFGSEIKIMPDTASERALERLRLHVCSSENNCTILLKEVSSEREEEQNRFAYEMKVKKKVRYFGIFPGEREIEAEVDSETGEVDVNKPWFVSMVDETVPNASIVE